MASFPHQEIPMLSRRHILPAFVAAILAIVSLAGDGLHKPLLADETDPCILGGSGVLCYTKEVQKCTAWGLGGWSLGTSFSMTTTCTEWTKIVEYYYRDGNSSSPKPGVK
jgi:hypothetical protein